MIGTLVLISTLMLCQVRMRDALRSELKSMEEKLNFIRKDLDDATSMLLSTSQVAAQQPRGGMVTVSRDVREKVRDYII
jgi:hypothetical protein